MPPGGLGADEERRLTAIERDVDGHEARLQSQALMLERIVGRVDNLSNHTDALSTHVGELRKAFLTLAGTIAAAAVVFALTVFSGLIH